jgi:hypothetical protein
MRHKSDYLREAAAAVAIAQGMFPLINPRGIGPYDHPYEPNQHSFNTDTGLIQVGTAIEFLLEVGLEPQTSSYAAKHAAERWGKANDMSPYVSNGAMIAAALYLGLEFDGDFEGAVYLG